MMYVNIAYLPPRFSDPEGRLDLAGARIFKLNLHLIDSLFGQSSFIGVVGARGGGWW